MTIKQWTGAGGTNGATATVANTGGISGDAFDGITLLAAGTATYSNTAPLITGQMALRLQVTATGDRARAYHSFTASDTLSERFAFRNRVDPGTGGNLMFSIVQATTFGGAAVLNIVNNGGTRELRLFDAAGTMVKSFGALSFGSAFGDWFIVDINATKGTTTTDGRLQCSVYNEAGTLIDTYLSTAANTGTNQFVRSQWGGTTSLAQDLEVAAIRGNNDAPAALVGLPSANTAPTASIMARPAPQVAGQVTVTGTITDPDGAITSASVAIVSGPNNPTVAVATSGLNSGTTNVSGTFTAIPGRYVVQVSGADSGGLASNVPTQTIDVFPPDGTPATPEVRLSGTYTTVGAASALIAVSDGQLTSYQQSPDSPTGQSEKWRMNPIGGDVSISLECYQSPASPTVLVAGTIYREDGTTVVQTFAGRAAPTTVGGSLAFTLSSGNQTALADPVNKRALIFEYSATQ